MKKIKRSIEWFRWLKMLSMQCTWPWLRQNELICRWVELSSTKLCCANKKTKKKNRHNSSTKAFVLWKAFEMNEFDYVFVVENENAREKKMLFLCLYVFYYSICLNILSFIIILCLHMLEGIQKTKITKRERERKKKKMNPHQNENIK